MTTTTQISPSLLEAVNALRQHHMDVVNAGDLEGSANLFREDGVSLPPGAPPMEGRPAIRAWFSQVFKQFRLVGFDLEVGGLMQAGDYVVEYGSWKAAFHAVDGSKEHSGQAPGAGTYLTVYGPDKNGTLKMVRDSFSGLPG